MLNMARAYYELGHEVTVMFMNTPKHFVYLRTLPAEIQQIAEFYAVEVNTDVKTADVLANLIFSRKSYHVQRFSSRRFRQELTNLLKRRSFDVVQIEGLFLASYVDTIRAESDATVSYRAHNVEHEIWLRRAKNEQNPIKKYLFTETAYRIFHFEEQTMQAQPFDLMIPITGRDAKALKDLGATMQMQVCGAGLSFDQLSAPGEPMEYPSVCYIGAMDWLPNQEGIDWFLKEVWPGFYKRRPDVTFYLAGRNMPSKYLELNQKGVKVLGEVEDAGEFLRSKAVLVVPLLSGSGMRVKIVEGMAYGKAIVATNLAAEGTGVRDGEHVMLADDPDEFANRMLTLLEQRNLFDIMAEKAAAYAKKKFDHKALAEQVVKAYEGLKKKKSQKK